MNSECSTRTVQHPKHIQAALEELSEYMEINYDNITVFDAVRDSRMLEAAQAELAELLSIHSLVKGFIEDNGIKCRGNINRCEVDEVLSAFKDICDIVGYKV